MLAVVMKRILKEPLLHFLLAGGLLFAGYAWLNHGGGDEPRVVRITAAEVDWLRETWTRQWQRPPSGQELRGLVTGYLKEVLLAREAKEIGLEENDTVVRRRLAQKMEFLVEDTARLAEPGENELRRLYDADRARYRTPAIISFSQIYFRTEAAARRGLENLGTRDPSGVGDRSLLERDYLEVDGLTVRNLFGGEFSEYVFAFETGKWQGPVPSGYGHHLVFVRERQDAQQLPFDEVRAQVQDEWYREQQARAAERFFAGLLKKYDVVVEEKVRPLIGPLAEVTR